MASTRTRVNGLALKIVNNIKADDEDELNVRRFSRLAGMLGGERTTWLILGEYGKAEIVSDARERLATLQQPRKEEEDGEAGRNAAPVDRRQQHAGSARRR